MKALYSHKQQKNKNIFYKKTYFSGLSAFPENRHSLCLISIFSAQNVWLLNIAWWEEYTLCYTYLCIVI